MLARKMLPVLFLARGTSSRFLRPFSTRQVRRSDYESLDKLWQPSPSPFLMGFLGRNYSATAQKDQTTTAEESDVSRPSRVAEPAIDSVDSVVAKLNETIAKHGEEIKDVKDKYMRALAETENVRQRLTRQIADAKQFGIQSFVKDLLEVSDILSKAMDSIPKEAFAQKNAHFDNLFEGLRLTEAQLTKVFHKHGLEKMKPIGEKFDPNEHEALFEAPAEGKETGTILTVTQPGFKLNKRVVRPARVGVVRNA